MEARVPAPTRSRGGRPSKGPRQTFGPRFEPELAALVQRDAYRRIVGVIELVDLLVAREFGEDVQLPTLKREVDVDLGAPPARTAVKLRQHLADQVVEQARARDISYSAYLEHLLRRAYGRPSYVPELVRPIARQEELVMGA